MGLSAGTAVIRYTVSNTSGCSAFAVYNVTVNAIPNVPSIAYALGTPNPQIGHEGAFCKNKTFTVVGNPSSGVWSSSNTSVLTVGSNSGVVNTVGLGNAILTYVISLNGCSNSRSIAGVVANCASRGVANNEEVRANSYELYPNPATSLLTINCKLLFGVGSMVLTDLYGKKLLQQPLSLGINTIDVSKLAKGMYFITIITEQGRK